jgi:hypothetical protein
MLYLTHLLDEEQLTGGQLRHRLRLLDRGSMLAGHSPPSRSRVMRSFMRGLYQSAALGSNHNREPLYLEEILCILDGIADDRLSQQQDVALILLANATGLTLRSLQVLTWNDVRLRRDRINVDSPRRGGSHGPNGRLQILAASQPQTVQAMKELRAKVGPAARAVFGDSSADEVASLVRLRRVLSALPARGSARWSWNLASPVDELELAPIIRALHVPSARQRRDAALVALAFTACLTAVEANQLRCGHVVVTRQGLLLNIPGRATATGVPPARGRHCPVALWQSWHAELLRQHRGAGTAPAFPAMRGSLVSGVEGLDNLTMIRIVERLALQARLDGHYSFTSLRIGFVRTAVRAGVSEPAILEQAGLRTLAGLMVHVRRERLVTHSVSGLVAL